MSALNRLAANVDDLRSLIGVAADHIQNLSHSLAYAQAQAADAAAIRTDRQRPPGHRRPVAWRAHGSGSKQTQA